MFNKLMRRQEGSTLSNSKGFTLLELLIVIVIIGILAVIIVPGLISGPKRARDATRKADLRSIKNALEVYHQDNGEYPHTLGAAGLTADDEYLKDLPVDPTNSGAQVYGYSVPAACTAANDADCTAYELNVTLENGADDDDANDGGDEAGVYEVLSENGDAAGL